MDFPIRMDPWRIIEKKFFECEQFETFFSTVVGKGQLISKCPFGVFKSPKKPIIFF